MTDNHLAKAKDIGFKIIDNVQKVIVGKDEMVKLGVAALFSNGHILVEGVPGVGKTMYARSLAKSVGVRFSSHPMYRRPASHRYYRCVHF